MAHDTTGLTHTRTHSLDAVSLNADQPPSQLWADLATTPAFQQQLVAGVTELLTGIPYHDAIETLMDAGITAADGGLARLFADFGLADCPAAHWRALRVVTQIGQGTVTPLGRLGFDALGTGPVAALNAVESSLTIAVRLDRGFRERRRDQREQILEVLATLARAVDVRVVCSALVARWLVTEHRAHLPAEFIESCNAGPQTDADTDTLVTAALNGFDADSRPVAMLRQLADDPGETLPYAALKHAHDDVGPSRVSQVVSTLEEEGLVEKWGPRRDQRVDLLPTGARAVERFDAECGRQQSLNAELSDSGHSSKSAVLSRPRERGSTDPPAQSDQAKAEAAPYSTSYLSRSSHHAAAGSATSGTISLASAQLPGCEDAYERHTRYVSYIKDRDEVVVAIRATTPLQYMTSFALALASPRLLDKALPPERLDTIDDPPAILRDARCIGGLTDAALADGNQLHKNIQKWADALTEMTTDLHAGEYEDRDRFCGEILRTAHGLAGSLVHLLDCAGVDLVRELRLPGALDSEQLAAIATTVGIATSIQSRYGAFATYRQLFEQREKKRQTALTPTVDAEDPLGEYIGSLVVRSPAVDRFEPLLVDALESPRELHEDAPEIAVHVPVTRPGRSGYAEVATRLCRTKGMRPTREAVDLLRALARSSFAVADAVRWLGSEDQPRQLRLDEVRVALAKLDADRLLPDAPPSVAKAVAALLSASEPLSRSALTERAGIHERSLRRHSDVLQALDLLRATEDGALRLALPFRESEKGERILPMPTDAEDCRRAAQDAAFEVAVTLIDLDDAGCLALPDNPLGAPFCGPPVEFATDINHLFDARPGWRPWLRLAQRLAGAETRAGDSVQFGAEPAQQPLSIKQSPAQTTAD